MSQLISDGEYPINDKLSVDISFDWQDEDIEVVYYDLQFIVGCDRLPKVCVEEGIVLNLLNARDILEMRKAKLEAELSEIEIELGGLDV